MTSPSVKDRHFVSNGVRLHYVEILGDGPPLVLLPGITMPAATWEFVGERLARRRRVYILDNRGRGLSEGGKHLGYRLDDYARDALGLIVHLHLGQPAVLGHSMGARIAIRLAATNPMNTGALVLVDPPLTGPGRRPYPTPLKQFIDSIDTVSCGGGWDDLRQTLSWTDAQLEMRMKWLPTCDKHAVAESHRSFHEEDVHTNMPHIRSDTLLMYAQRGDTVREVEADEVVRLIPSCRKILMTDSGHMIPWDNLDGFAAAVESFLSASDANNWNQICQSAGSLFTP